MKTIYVLLAVLCFSLISCNNQIKPLKVNTLPSKMLDNRYILQLKTQNNDTLEFFTDTGGGFDIIWKSTFENLNVSSKKKQIRGNEMTAVEWKSIRLKSPYQNSKLFNEELIVFPKPDMMPESDGFLGGSLFVKGEIWEFDYINKSIGTIDSINWSQRKTNQVPMKIQKDEAGELAGIHPGLDVVIDKDTLTLLFDTGATFIPTEEGRQVLKPENLETYSGSYLSIEKINELHEKHPEWNFVKGGEMGGRSDLIEIPNIKLGKYFSGSAWFASRPKTNFIQIDNEFLDGAIGGNVLKDFKVIADYKAYVFEFEK